MSFIDNLKNYYIQPNPPESLADKRDLLIEDWIERLWEDGFSGNQDQFTAEAGCRADQDIADREVEIKQFPAEFNAKLTAFKTDLDEFLSSLDTDRVEISQFRKTHFPDKYQTASGEAFSEVWSRENVRNHILNRIQDTRKPMEYVSFALTVLANQI